jgi:dTDP-N-acetylfucosamine:lipid II N-acetylfucosaminyltransferase
MNTKIIHIFNDDKFVDAAIAIMELSHPNESEYFVVKNNEGDFDYVKSNIVKRIRLKSDTDYFDFIAELKSKKSQVIFLHALDSIKQRIVILLPDAIVKVWLIWGFDLYGNWQLFNNKLYQKETQKVLEKKPLDIKYQLASSSFSFWLFHKTLKKQLWLPRRILAILHSNFYTAFYQAAEKIDIVVPVISDEYGFVKKLKIEPKLSTFSYGTLENLLQSITIESVLNSKNILIGNSADPSNNHLDVFSKIANYNFGDRKLFVPLSYGGSTAYKNIVIARGKQLFGDNFVPLLDFMTLEQYNKILASCGFVIFNHIRQQGVGNVVALGFLGAKLFLNSKSPVLHYLSRKGMKLFAFDSITELELSENLNIEILQSNKTVLMNEYSKQAVHQKVLNLIKMIEFEVEKKLKV